MARTAPEGECVVFTGSRLRSGGYGQVSGTAPDWTPLRAHRVVYEHHHGPIPPGLVVMHSCDNPPCVRIEHLSAETHSMNLKDAIDKGRHRTPPGGRPRRVSADTVLLIRAAPTGAEASRLTGLSQSHVSLIRRGLIY